MSDVDLTVVVLSWNTRAHTLAALRSVPAACAPLRARVVCVDNGSTDGSARAVREALPDVLVVENAENLGFARGNAAALPHLAGRAVAFLNSDTVASPGSLAAAVESLDRRPQVGIVSPRLVGPDGSPQRAAWPWPRVPDLLRRYTALRWAGVGALGPRAPDATAAGRVEAVSGACLVIRRDLCERLGGFDPGYPFYVEDVDLCWRATRLGAEVHVLPDGPPVMHHGGASTALSEGAVRLPMLQGQMRFLRKRLGPGRAAAFEAVFKAGVVHRALLDLPRLALRAAVHALRGRRDRASRDLAAARERVRFLERDLRPFLRA